MGMKAVGLVFLDKSLAVGDEYTHLAGRNGVSVLYQDVVSVVQVGFHGVAAYGDDSVCPADVAVSTEVDINAMPTLVQGIARACGGFQVVIPDALKILLNVFA